METGGTTEKTGAPVQWVHQALEIRLPMLGEKVRGAEKEAQEDQVAVVCLGQLGMSGSLGCPGWMGWRASREPQASQ